MDGREDVPLFEPWEIALGITIALAIIIAGIVLVGLYGETYDNLRDRGQCNPLPMEAKV